MKTVVILVSMIALMGATNCKDEIRSHTATPMTAVPDEFVGAWENGSIDFVFWENYRQGYWAGRNATPSREAMIFNKNGEAKFYRYEFAFGAYEELIDCKGTVTFNGDGTFNFYPTSGRKRYYSARHPEDNKDRMLNSTELKDPDIAGRRGYVYSSSKPHVIQILVPGSAPYNWYKKS